MKILVVLLISMTAYSGTIFKVSEGLDKQPSLLDAYMVNLGTEPIILREIRQDIAERLPTKEITYKEYYLPIDTEIKSEETRRFDNSDVVKLRDTGRDDNRIVLTFLGDGYTMQEREKFFDDVNFMINDLFSGVTFSSYLPLFNIYAVFTPSNESGITDLIQRDTVFKLFRSPRGSKRAVMPGDRRALRQALKLTGSHTDYPIVIANDPFYGGLGGEFAITTSSRTSGHIVLRHELGHNFSNVGEEYDGGQVYRGANFSASSRVPWEHWLEGDLEVHRSQFLTGSYVWQDLNQEFNLSFNFPDDFHYYQLSTSFVGLEAENDVSVSLNGNELDIAGNFTQDRSFFETVKAEISPGEYQLKIKNTGDDDNVLAFANGYAFKEDYNFTPNLVGAFNVFGASNRERGFRPTHNSCLMRDMSYPKFCVVDQENIWLRFLNKVSLIDHVVDEGATLRLEILAIPGVEILWFDAEGNILHRGHRIDKVLNPLKVQARLTHPEIRKDSRHLSDELIL